MAFFFVRFRSCTVSLESANVSVTISRLENISLHTLDMLSRRVSESALTHFVLNEAFVASFA